MKVQRGQNVKKIKKFVPNRHPGREGHLTATSKLFCGKTLYLLLILFLSIALFAGLIFTVENGEKVFLREEEVIAASGNWTDSGNYDTNWSGSGTESDPYIIESAADLAGLAAICSSDNNYRDKYFQQIGSIDLSAHYWTPIDSFGGHYDGGQNTISGMTISSSTSHAGLFGSITGIEDNLASVKKIGIVDTTIYGVDYVGSVAGSAQFSRIEYCYNECDIEPSGDHVGGIVGLASLNTTISCCYNTGDITIKGEDYGGIVGLAGLAAIVTNCYNRGSISTGFNAVETRQVGGIIGNGGLVAGAFNCYNTGSVGVAAAPEDNPGEYLGGICGSGGAFSCFNIGPITTFLNFNIVAGICAETGLSEASYCYNLGSFVSGAEIQAAIVASGDASGCYYGGDCSSNTGGYSGGDGEGAKYSASLNKNNFKSQSYMTASSNWDTEYPWDFTNIWEFRSGENDGYPVLKKLAYTVTFDAEGGNANYADVVEGFPYTYSYNTSSHKYSYKNGQLNVTYDTQLHILTLNGTGNVSATLPSSPNITFKANEVYTVTTKHIGGSTSGGVGCFVLEAGASIASNMTTRNFKNHHFPTSDTPIVSASLTISSFAETNGTALRNWFWNGDTTTKRTFSNYQIQYRVVKTTGSNGDIKSITVQEKINAVSIPFKEGYVFKGYYSSPNGQGTKHFSETGACLIQPGADMKLYAYWEDTWLNHAATSFAGGSGMQSDPYQIANASQLALLAKNVYNGTGTHSRDAYIYEGVYFKQTANIDLSQYKWVPIGIYYNLDNVITDYNFSGIYDGMGYTISGIELPSVTGGNADRRGLFGRINGSDCSVPCQILNVNVADSTITGGSYIGGLVGYAGTNAIITNCSVDATVTGSSDYVGGIVGNSVGTSVTSCVAQGAVTGGGSTGGIMGEGSAQISNCYNTASVKGSPAGGIVGYGSAYVSYSYNYGLVSANKPNYEAGGIAGINLNMIQYCGNYAKVSGLSSSSIGGIVGGSDGCDVYYCTNTGDVLGSGVSTAGGIVGHLYDGDVVACYNSASSVGDSQTSSTSTTGGIVGGMEDVCIISGCASSSVLTGMGVGGIVGAVNSGSYQIQQCVSTGIIKVTDPYTMIGGIVGVILEDCEILIDLCFVKAIMLNTLADDANTYAGGIVGVVVPALDIGFAKISRCGAVVGTISGLLDTESSIIKIYPFSCNTATGYNMPVESSYSIIFNPQDPDNGYGYVAYAEEYEQPFDGSFGVNIDKYGWESFASGEPLDTISSVEIGLPLPIGTYAIAQFGSTDGGDIIMRVEEFAGAIGQPVIYVNYDGSYTEP